MNTQNIKDILKSVREKESDCLVRKIIIYKSPINGEIEYRVAYFLNHMEASIWEADRVRLYKELKIDTIVQTDVVNIGERDEEFI